MTATVSLRTQLTASVARAPRERALLDIFGRPDGIVNFYREAAPEIFSGPYAERDARESAADASDPGRPSDDYVTSIRLSADGWTETKLFHEAPRRSQRP